MKEKILITVNDFCARFPEASDYLEKKGIEIINAPLDSKEASSVLKNVEVLFVASEKCDSVLFDRAEKLKMLCKMGAGVDNIDLDECRKRNIRVATSKGQNANAVAEMALCLILSSLRNLRLMMRSAETAAWQRRIPGCELKGKTVGFIGFGQIAGRLASLLSSFDVKIIAYDPYIDLEKAKSLNCTPLTFEEVVSQADVLTVHIPATLDNYHLFDKDVFALMKNGSVFINCSRGSLVDEDDLYDSLLERHLYAAAIDVWNSEPLKERNKLFDLDNFIGTPHCAGTTFESMYNDSMTIARVIADFLGSKSF